MLRQIFVNRVFEDTVGEMVKNDLIKGTTHLSIGQEIIDVCMIQSSKSPIVFGNHRSHGQYLASTAQLVGGGDIEGLIEQIINYRTQHLYYPDRFLSTGIQGGLVPTSIGYALERKDKDVFCFIGDGTFGEGVLYESFYLASYLKSPVKFVVINNKYSMSKTPKIKDFTEMASDIAKSFNILFYELDNDIKSIQFRTKNLPKDFPSIYYFEIDRVCGHSCNDTQMYRSKEEKIDSINNDPVVNLMVENSSLYEDTKREVANRVEKWMDKNSDIPF